MRQVRAETTAQRLWKRMYKERWAYLLLLPVLLFFLIFHYFPMYGIQLAFKDFAVRKGITGSPWVGWKHFQVLFRSVVFWQAVRNTLLISLYKLIFGFPASVIFALMVNELRTKAFRNTVQTISYLPHFLSWVILGSIVHDVLSLDGVINYLISLLGGTKIQFLTEPKCFRAILVITGMWKEVGWGSIIYLAAIAGINTDVYEAAAIDGASRMKIILKIILPMLASVMSIQFILQLGNILNAGFDQVFNLYNTLVYSTGDIIDTYVYRIGMTEKLQYSLSTAVGLFKNVIGFALVVLSNAIIRRIGDGGNGIW